MYAVAVVAVFVYVKASSMEDSSTIPAILVGSEGQTDGRV